MIISRFMMLVIGIAIGSVIATPFLLLNIIGILVKMRREQTDVQ